MPAQRRRWILFAAALAVVCLGGLGFGKIKERDYVASLYERHDFTLLDDQGQFFRLGATPERILVLLVFTPDGIPPAAVKQFYEFGQHVDELRRQGIETFLISRTSRDIVLNFKEAARFPGRLLFDTGGTVGRNAGVWDYKPVATWSYALVDPRFHVRWLATSDEPMSFAQLTEELRKAR